MFALFALSSAVEYLRAWLLGQCSSAHAGKWCEMGSCYNSRNEHRWFEQRFDSATQNKNDNHNECNETRYITNHDVILTERMSSLADEREVGDGDMWASDWHWDYVGSTVHLHIY